MAIVTPAAARRPRAYVRVQGADAVDYLNRMLSNDVPESGSVDALLLTPKARVIAPVLVWRRGADDVLLLTEPELGEPLRSQLTRMRFAAKCEIAAEEHTSTIVFGEAGRHPEPRLRRSLRSRCSTRAGRRGRGRARAAADRARRRRATAARSTTASCRPRPASRSGRSRSPRAAIPGRSRSPGSTTAARSTAACACSR